MTINDLQIPSVDRLEKLLGGRVGQHRIRINDCFNCQWHICFIWEEGHAWDAEIVDYH